MSICKKKGSPYYQTRFSICGIRVQESTRTTSKSEAYRYEEKRRRDIREQVLLGNKPKKSWIEAKARWLTEMQHKRSIRGDILQFDWLGKWLDHYSMDDISKEVIESIAQQKESEGASVATVNRLLALIRAVMNRAYKRWEWINRVPVFPMRHEDNARIRWLTRDEAKKLLSELPPHLEAMARFTLATGLRAKNVAYLAWDHIDMLNEHAVIPRERNKTNKDLGVPLNQEAMAVLKGQVGGHPKFVFVYGGRPATQCSTRAWRKALKRAGIKDFRWHDLRHTWASWHVQSGTSLHELCELGGWASFEMVLRYGHLSSKHLKNAANRISGAKLVQHDSNCLAESA